MYFSHLLLVLVIAIGHYYVVAQRCPSCKAVESCSEAVELVKQSKVAGNKEKLRAAFCGVQNGHVQVCCDELSSKPTSSGDSTSLDSHPNLKLLPENCGFAGEDKIIGGTVAGLYEFPWMALISYRTGDGLKFLCGGSVINERYILTAAHCLAGRRIAGVRVGEHDVSSSTDCWNVGTNVECETKLQDIRVEKEIPHPNYQPQPNVDNDIALLRLAKPINFTYKNAKAICLPVTSSLRDRDLSDNDGVVSGWGYTEDRLTSSVLLKVEIPIYTKQACKNFYNRGQPAHVDKTKNKLCAGKRGKDSCQGDSGGPLAVLGQHNGRERLIQYGVVSYGPQRCGSDFPGVYTDISKFMDWILDNIKA